MVTAKFTPCGSRVCIVKVYSYADRNPEGIIQNPNFEQDASFANLTQLLFSMESLFDEIGSPQRVMKPRGFVAEQAEVRCAAEAPACARPLATFRIDIMFRQNASWQGNLVWLERKAEAQFRSALELITIMDSAFRARELQNAPDTAEAG